jgi:hypothetical protein
MPPLPDTVSVLLRSSPTAAMAALLLISTSHRGLLDWFSRTVCGDAAVESGPESQPKPRGRTLPRAGKTSKSNGHRQPRSNGDDPYLSGRRAQRDRDDQALLAALRSNPEGSIGDWATTIRKSRTSCVSGLHRLRAAGLAQSVEGKWKQTEPPAPREPPAKWTTRLSASQRAHASA